MLSRISKTKCYFRFKLGAKATELGEEYLEDEFKALLQQMEQYLKPITQQLEHHLLR